MKPTFSGPRQVLATLPARIFTIDPRSLTVFRAALGSLVLLDLAARARELADHYSDWGVLPRRALGEEPTSAYRFCVHAWGGATSYEALLFAAAGGLAVAFALGRGGAVVTAVLWALTVSLQNRNFMILNKGDQIFRLLLLWSILLPLRSRSPVLSLAGAGLMVQAALVWLVSACLKTDRAWFPDGTATYFALQMDHGTTSFGHWFGANFVATRVVTYATYFIEWAAFFLLFSPACTTLLRSLAIALLTAMHVGFGVSMRLGFFPAISVCSLIPFVPAAWWDRLGWRANVAAGDPGRFRRFRSALAAGSLLLVLWINASAVARGRIIAPPVALGSLAQFLRLDQDWAMFAPYPDRAGGWYVVAGHLANGQAVDAYHPSLNPPRYEKPERLSSTFPTARSVYYMTNLAKPENAAEIPWFARYLCRRFDAAHVSDVPLRDVEITFFREWVLPGYTRTHAQPEALRVQSCDERF